MVGPQNHVSLATLLENFHAFSRYLLVLIILKTQTTNSHIFKILKVANIGQGCTNKVKPKHKHELIQMSMFPLHYFLKYHLLSSFALHATEHAHVVSLFASSYSFLLF